MKKINNKKLILAVPLFIFLICFGLGIVDLALNGEPAHAGTGPIRVEETGLEETATTSGLPRPELTTLIGNIIRAAFSVVGVVFFVILLYGGFLWMTASGNEDRIKKAKSLMTNSIIGLLIIIAAYAISEFVIRLLLGGEVFTPEAPIEE